MRIAILSCLTALLCFVSCKSEKDRNEIPLDDLNEYSTYIAEISQGIISTESDIRVVLAQPVEGWEEGTELEKDLLRAQPGVKGRLVALNSRTLAFVPEDELEQDTEYRFTLKLGALIADLPEDRKELNFGIKTIRQQFNVYTEPLRSYNKNFQYLEGQIRAADLLSLSEAQKLLHVTQNGKELQVAFEPSVKKGRQLDFRIDSIPRLEEDSQLVLNWSGEKLGIKSSGKNTLKVPGKNNFTLLGIQVDQHPQQLIQINFSDPLNKTQNFSGLVILEGDDRPRYAVEGNALKIYPSKEVKGTVLLELFEGIRNEEGYKTKGGSQHRLAFERLKPQIRFLSNATILPSSSNLKINFEAVNLLAADATVLKIYPSNILQFLQNNELGGSYNLRTVARPIARKRIRLQNSLSEVDGKWQAHALDLSTLITPEPGALYRVELDIKPVYSAYNCTSTNFDSSDAQEEDFDEEQEESSWDGIEAYYGDSYENYDWNERENPCHTSYYYDKKVGLNVLASDIGLTVKKGANHSYFVAVNDLLNTNPIPGAVVTFYNYQQQPMGKTTTDADGTSIFDSERPAFFARVENGSQKTYLKLNDGNALSVSKFDVSGVSLQKGLKGFLFAERGVWRPGDPIFLSFILNDKASELPSGHPVKLELLDPYGKVVHREVNTGGINGFHSFQVGTDTNAPTGNWLARVSVGGAVFTKSLKIETIKPNRLKIDARFSQEILRASGPIDGSLEVQWLHGATARNLKADITAKFVPKTTTFRNFPSYVFDDPTRRFSPEEQNVFDGFLNEEGRAKFQLKPQLTKEAPGMLTASLVTKVYEEGGDFSTDVFTKTYSPYTTYVGLNAPKGDKARGMLLTDTKHRFEIVTLDERGNTRPTKDLKVTIYKVQWRWWWDTSEDNLSGYSGSNYREKVFEQNLSTGGKGKAEFEFELKYPEWGRYLVRVEDPEGGHATGKTLYMDWPGWAGRSRKNDPSAATMLVLSADKEAYAVGETATVAFPSSENGRALVTLENGVEVLEAFWIKTKKGETRHEIPIKALYAPNVYVHVSLLQPHASTLNDAPIRLYGVIPISVENKATRLQPEVEIPAVLRPEETVTLKVSEKSGRAMTYSLAMVDEGLLDLTRFQTPDPWKGFYARQALGVKTWDVYDDVIGAYGGRIDQVFSIGGDGSLAGARNKKANRFEPMVVHLGPFELKAGQSGTHKIRIPKYVGSVRTMLIASNRDAEAYGNTEVTTPVRKPLMVLASLPRKITPGERVTLPVTVFAMDKKIRNVTLKLQTDKTFEISGSSSRQVHFTRPGEKIVYFDLDVSPLQGLGKVMIQASGHGESASFEVPVQAINPNTPSTEVKDFVIEGGSQENISLSTFGIPGSNEIQVELSTLPPMNFNGRMKYLIHYPHGCVEQITSSAFPQLYLGDVFELSTVKAQEIQRNIETAVKRLGNYQLPGGGFAYWPGDARGDDWGTSYAGHFLLEAAEKGYLLPIGFKSSWVSYQQRLSKQWRTGQQGSDLAQAYRLYTLALSGNADIASMNRLRETAGLGNESRYRLAAAYGLIGQNSIAKDLLRGVSTEFTLRADHSYTYGSRERNRAMALETLVLLEEKSKAREMAEKVAKSLNEKRWMSTQSTAYSLLAMARFAAMIGGRGIAAGLTANGNNEVINTDRTMAVRSLDIRHGDNELSIQNKGSNTLYLSTVNTGVLPVGEERTQRRNLSLAVSYKGRDGTALKIDKIRQGTNFVAEISVTNTTSRKVENIALTSILPSGWEIVNTRFTDFGTSEQTNASYMDIRDDRVHFYFELEKNESRTFRVLLNASYLGRYYLPGSQVEAMYDNNFSARTAGRWVEVIQ